MDRDLLHIEEQENKCSVCASDCKPLCIVPSRFEHEIYPFEMMCDTCLYKFLNVYHKLFKYLREREIKTIQ